METKSKLPPQKKIILWLIGIVVVAVVAVFSYAGATGTWVKGLILTTKIEPATNTTIYPANVTYKYLNGLGTNSYFPSDAEIYEDREPAQPYDVLMVTEFKNNYTFPVYLKKIAVNADPQGYTACEGKNDSATRNQVCDVTDFPSGKSGFLISINKNSAGQMIGYFPVSTDENSDGEWDLNLPIQPGQTVTLAIYNHTTYEGKIGRNHSSAKVALIGAKTILTDENDKQLPNPEFDKNSIMWQPIKFK